MLRTIVLSLFLVIVVAAAFAGGSYWSFDRSMDSEVAGLVAAAGDNPRAVTEVELAGLPAPVRRYLSASGVVGRPVPSIVRLKQVGRLRGSPDADWMAFEAEQVYTTNPPGLVWRAWFPSRRVPVVTGRDAYLEGTGGIEMKMLGFFPVASESGGELTDAVLMRFLNEIMWFPQAYIGDNVTWRGIDAHSAEVTLSDRGRNATGTVFFDDEGRQANFRARRFNTETRGIEIWETPITGYGEFDGVAVPTSGQGVWKLEGGDFVYIELEIVEIAYQ